MRPASVDANVKTALAAVPHVVMLCRMMHRREQKFRILHLCCMKKVVLKLRNGSRRCRVSMHKPILLTVIPRVRYHQWCPHRCAPQRELPLRGRRQISKTQEIQELPDETTHARSSDGRCRPDRLQPAVPHRQRRNARQGPAGNPSIAGNSRRARAKSLEGRDDGTRRLRLPAAARHGAGLRSDGRFC